MKKNLMLLVALLCSAVSGYCAHVDTILVHSEAMDKDVKCVVVVPDSYYASSTSTKYPVFYLLHGWSGSYSDWVKNASTLQPDVDAFQMIVVCPDGGYGSWYFDSPKVPAYRYETFESKELLSYIDGHYKTIANRKGRATGGLSMGGHGALFLAIKHKDTYGAAVSMSGGVDFRPFPDQWQIKDYLGSYAENKDLWTKNTVEYLAETDLKDGDLAISFECGTGDFFLPVNRQLHETLIKKGIKHDYAERPGHHDWKYWNNCLGYQMLFIHRYFQGVKL